MGTAHASVEIIVRGVACVDGLVLLCRTRGASNTYLPGGHLDFGESARACLEREIREELGLACSAGAFLGVVEHAFVQKGRPHCEVNLVFAFHAPELRAEAPVPSMEEHIGFAWVRLDGLGGSDLEPEPLRALLPEWLASGASDRFASTFPSEPPRRLP